MNRQSEKNNHLEKRLAAAAKKQQELMQRIESLKKRSRELLG